MLNGACRAQTRRHPSRSTHPISFFSQTESSLVQNKRKSRRRMQRHESESDFNVSSHIHVCTNISFWLQHPRSKWAVYIPSSLSLSFSFISLALSSSSVLLVTRFLIKGDSVGACTSIACPYYSALKALHSLSSLEGNVPYFISLHHQTKNGTKFIHMWVFSQICQATVHLVRPFFSFFGNSLAKINIKKIKHSVGSSWQLFIFTVPNFGNASCKSSTHFVWLPCS